MNAIQTDLFGATACQRFEAWKATPGGKHILNLIYRKAAGYAGRYKRTGRRVSIRLLWEQLRDHVAWNTRQMTARGVQKVDGYRLNDVFHAYAARHIVDHRPDWKGMFQLREVGKVRGKRKVLVITEKKEPNNSRLLCHAVGEHSKPNALQRTVSRVLQKMI